MDSDLTNIFDKKATLLSLPTEIRLQIIRGLIDPLIFVTIRFDGFRYTWPLQEQRCGLLTVSRQTSEEFLYVLYSNTQFNFHSVQAMTNFSVKTGKVNSHRIQAAVVGFMGGIEPLLQHPSTIRLAMPNLRFLSLQGIGRGRPRKAKTPASPRFFSPEEWDKKHLRVIQTLSTMPGLAGGRIICTSRHSRMTVFWGPGLEITSQLRSEVEIDLAEAERECTAQGREEGKKRYQARKRLLKAKQTAQETAQG